MKTRLIIAGLLMACAIAANATPAFGDSEGTVSAQVSVAAPCIQVAPTQLDFGTLGFSSKPTSVAASRALTATNCGASASLLGHGTNATSTAGTTWVLEPSGANVCSSPNRYVQRIDTGPTSIPLSTADVTLRPLAGGEAASLNAIVVMPCVGSSGAGEVMTFSYVFTALLG
jgi:spore coat protein U-like protein